MFLFVEDNTLSAIWEPGAFQMPGLCGFIFLCDQTNPLRWSASRMIATICSGQYSFEFTTME
jgi:hypothetical protein